MGSVTSYLNSLNLSFLNYKIGINKVPTSHGVVVGIKLVNKPNVFSTLPGP